jgi:hypothetical protein
MSKGAYIDAETVVSMVVNEIHCARFTREGWTAVFSHYCPELVRQVYDALLKEEFGAIEVKEEPGQVSVLFPPLPPKKPPRVLATGVSTVCIGIGNGCGSGKPLEDAVIGHGSDWYW